MTTASNGLQDAALSGSDPLPRIVDVQPLLGTSPARVRLYQRSADFGHVLTSEESFYPFFFVSDIRLLQGLPRSIFRFQRLGGDNFFNHLVVFTSWSDYWKGIRQVEQHTQTQGGPPEELYRINSPRQQYLMQTGRTSFREMNFNDLHRLQLDLEVFSREGFPQAEREEDEIIIIALSDNRGWSRLIDGRNQPERAMLKELVRVIQNKNPDVIEGHNIFAFDFDYLLKRCALHDVSFGIGRDGSAPRSFSSSMRFAERVVDFPALSITGRHVIDTYFQVMSFDVFKRDLPGYSLKAAARYFGFAPEGRTYVEGDEIGNLWRKDPERLLDYALDDVTETERLARHLSGSTFYLTQMLPMPYGQVARTGPASKIEGLFIREYLRQKTSFPRSEWGSQAMGGYTDLFFTGVAGPIAYADVESLYPSIMLNYDIQPEGDTLDLFPGLLQRLTDLRLDAKRQMHSAASKEERSELDARQSSYKILINSFYGSLGFSLAAFNDFSEADRVARIGQDILRSIIQLIQERGGQVIEADTDGVLFVPPPEKQGEEAERAFVDSLNTEMPEGIHIGFDGRFQKMLSYKKKNYALLTYDDTLKFKGSSLISRSNERFGRRFVRRAIRLLLNEDLKGLHALYIETRDRIIDHDWDGVEQFSRTETLKEATEQYEADVKDGKRPRAAAYELAIEHAAETGQPARKGDRISYYITGSEASVTAFRNCKLAAAWRPAEPDENTAYYLKRLDEFTRKFEPFFSEHDFRLLFSPEDLFGFSAEGIAIRSEAHSIEEAEPEDEVPF